MAVCPVTFSKLLPKEFIKENERKTEDIQEEIFLQNRHYYESVVEYIRSIDYTGREYTKCDEIEIDDVNYCVDDNSLEYELYIRNYEFAKKDSLCELLEINNNLNEIIVCIDKEKCELQEISFDVSLEFIYE